MINLNGRNLILLGLAAVTAAACAAPGPIRGGAPVSRAGEDGHRNCYVCHRSGEPGDARPYGFAAGADPSLVCQDCHHYERNHHPVNVDAAATGYVNVSRSGLPLFDGQIRCLTCHEGHGAADGSAVSSAPHLLRGGPFKDRRAICFACHEREPYTRINPHRMVDEAGRIRSLDGKPVCTFCHDEVPDTLDHTTQISFGADVAFLCWRCHAPMAGDFLDRHFHVTPSVGTRERMESLLNRKNVRLPLGVDGMLTCSTCHNPHQKGVLLDGPVSTGADEPRRLRLGSEEMCSACHGAI